MNYKIRKIAGWTLFGIASGVLFSIIINISMGSYIPPNPSYYRWNIIACLILAGIAVVSWKLAHSKKREQI